MRAALKRSVERLLCGARIARAARAFYRGRTIVLAYHNIVPAGETVRGEASLHLPQAQFARQLDLLQRTHDVVPLEALRSGRRRGRPRAVITFDDACQGALTAGVDELAKRGLPATIFVAPGLLGGRTFWWDSLAGPDGQLADPTRQFALHELQGRETRIREWAREHHWAVNEARPHQTGGTEEQLQATVAIPGITLGAHSWSHANLEQLDVSDLPNELARPLSWLRERFERVVPWFAYPYGNESAAVRQAARAAGYVGACLISGGWVRGQSPADLFAVPRLNVPAGVSLEGFELRVSGLLT